MTLPDGSKLSFYVNPSGFDKLTAQSPCCGWMIKMVQPKKAEENADDDEQEIDSDEEDKDDGCFMTLMHEDMNLLVESIVPPMNPQLAANLEAALEVETETQSLSISVVPPGPAPELDAAETTEGEVEAVEEPAKSAESAESTSKDDQGSKGDAENDKGGGNGNVMCLVLNVMSVGSVRFFLLDANHKPLV